MEVVKFAEFGANDLIGTGGIIKPLVEGVELLVGERLKGFG